VKRLCLTYHIFEPIMNSKFFVSLNTALYYDITQHVMAE